MNLCNHRSFVSWLAIGLMILIIGIPALAQTDEAVLVGKDDTVTFETPVRIGKRLLPPGDYLVRHTLVSNDHVVTFKKISVSSNGQSASAAGSEAVRVICRLKPLGAASKYTELHYTLNHGSKTKTLQHLLVQSENVKHMF